MSILPKRAQSPAADLDAQIADLKERRSRLWQKALPKNINDLAPETAQRLARKAEAHVRVLELDAQIRDLRFRQIAQQATDGDQA